MSPTNNQSRDPLYLLIDTLGKHIDQVATSQEDLRRYVMESIKEYATREQIERVKGDIIQIRDQVDEATKDILKKMDDLSQQQADQQLNSYKSLAARQTAMLGVVGTTVLSIILSQIFPSFFTNLLHLFRP